MLTTTTRNIGHLGLGGIYVAHVIRTQDEQGNDSYLLGLSLGNGQPIGMLVQHNASRFRRWVKLSGVEDFLNILRPKVAMLNVYPADGPVQRIKDNLIVVYRLDNPVDGDTTLEAERQGLLAVLNPDWVTTHGRNQDSTDP